MASETRFIRGHFSPCNEVDQFGLTVLHLRQEFFCLQLSLYPTYKVTKNLEISMNLVHRFLEMFLCLLQCSINKSQAHIIYSYSSPYHIIHSSLHRHINRPSNRSFWCKQMKKNIILETCVLFVKIIAIVETFLN